MKQRLSKLALLAVAAAFIVAGFPACSGEEEPEPPAQATATFTGEGIPESGLALTAGELKEVTATLKVANTAFSEATQGRNADDDIEDLITVSADDEKVAISGVKVKDKANNDTMSITFTVTADSGAEKTGNITATLKAAALTAAKDVAATGAISYTVTPNAQRPDPQPEEPVATLKGSGVSLTIDEEGTATATVTLENAKFAAEITADSFAVTAGDNVSATVTGATRTSDTVATLTLSVTAEDGAKAGNISVTVNAGAVADYDKAIAATGAVAYTVKEAAKPEDPVYFESFVASEFGDANSTDKQLTSADGLVTTGTRNAYQINQPYQTNDYNEDAKTGYSYTARIKIKTSQTGKPGTLTITHVKVGDILRIDGGNGSGNGDVRKMGITGADETEWESTVHGSFYLTATADTIVLESMTNEFNIYGIHVVDKKVEESVVSEVTTYEKPTLSLSAESVVKGEEVTVTATIPAATKTTTYSTGKVESEKVPVDAAISYDGTMVTDGKVDTSAEGTLTITASYTVGEDTYKSDTVTLKVTKAFDSQTKNVENNEATLGLIASGEATSTNPAVATAEISGGNIVITSKEKGETTITVGDGTNTARIVVTVEPDGEIGYKVYKYAVIETITWALTDKDHLSGVSTLTGLEVGSVEGYASGTKVDWTDKESLFKYEGENTITVAVFKTNLRKAVSECISKGNYAQIVITNNTSKDVILSELEYTHSIGDKNSGYGCQAFYWIGEVTGAGTTLATSAYGTTAAILTKAKVAFAEDTVVVAGQSVTIRFAYYGGNNGDKECALKDVVLSVK